MRGPREVRSRVLTHLAGLCRYSRRRRATSPCEGTAYGRARRGRRSRLGAGGTKAPRTAILEAFAGHRCEVGPDTTCGFTGLAGVHIFARRPPGATPQPPASPPTTTPCGLGTLRFPQRPSAAADALVPNYLRQGVTKHGHQIIAAIACHAARVGGAADDADTVSGTVTRPVTLVRPGPCLRRAPRNRPKYRLFSLPALP